ncbi:sulfotransferase 1B1-like [Branchiostoma lanceolatum]|uniref:sulfotransferase 1B1-like n=1 Tax=Branchiostoma lanceolatum TaxID=7740 RepID=UPI0034527579
MADIVTRYLPWLLPRWLLPMHLYKNTVYPRAVTRENLEAMSSFQMRDDDIVIVSYPKTGTNWLLEIVTRILQAAGKSEATSEDRAFAKLEFRYPELPQTSHLMLADSPSPRVILTHLRPDTAPPGIANPEGNVKVIVIMRNPKDAAVSFYHFALNVSRKYSYFGHIAAYFLTWDIFCNDFLAGKAMFGDFYDHVLSWWQKRHDPHFLFLKYEDMQKNLTVAVKNVADFLEMEVDDNAIKRIAQDCTFHNMRQVFDASNLKDRTVMARKGVVGDWKNHFTPEQSRAFDAIYRERLEGSGLEFEFE